MNLKKVSIVAVGILILGGAFVLGANAASVGSQLEKQPTPPTAISPTIPAVTAPTPTQPELSLDDPASLWVMPNKTRPLPYNYRPASLVTPQTPLRGSPNSESMRVNAVMASDLQTMTRDMRAIGLNIALVSGFRSAQTQEQLYNNYVAQFGRAEADRFSARPGTSEHQTGLAIDVGRVDGAGELDQSFGDTPEGEWIAQNAHLYGFIVRYPQGKEHVVGYMYEPWHLRYVGKNLAHALFSQQLTMEEYFAEFLK